MSNVFKFKKDISKLEVNIEDKIYIIDFSTNPNLSSELVKFGEEIGKIKNDDVESFIAKSKEVIELLLGEGAFDEIFEGVTLAPEYILQLFEYLLTEINEFNKERFKYKYDV